MKKTNVHYRRQVLGRYIYTHTIHRTHRIVSVCISILHFVGFIILLRLVDVMLKSAINGNPKNQVCSVLLLACLASVQSHIYLRQGGSGGSNLLNPGNSAYGSGSSQGRSLDTVQGSLATIQGVTNHYTGGH